MTDPLSRPALTIDLAAIAANWRHFAAIGPAEAAAVVKADAYGCGAAAVGPALRRAGCAQFFVATGPEARALRRALAPVDATLGAEAAIYVLGGPREPDWPEANAWPVISSAADLDLALRRGGPQPCALQLETGMNRLGLTAAEQAAILAAPPAGLDVRLVMSHFAAADEPESDLTALQAGAFAGQVPEFRAAFPEARFSLAATAGSLADPSHHYDLIRPGVGLFGGLPFAAARPAVRLEAPILRVWPVEAGERSGYGGTWRAARPSTLATIPVGYADGVHRALSNRGEARVNGRIVPFAGRVSMDLIVLDVTEAGAVAPGDAATLLDETLTVDRMAENAGTIGYEILTSLGRRYERRYTPA